jgi:ABC-2 type transport system permease protein
MMRAAWIVMRKDLLRRLRSPMAPLVYLAFPFIFSGLIALAFGGGGGGGVPRVKVALVDQDGDLAAHLVLGAFNREEVGRFFESTQTTLGEALDLIERKKVAGAIVIPEGFSRAVLEKRQVHLRVIKNPAEAIGPLAIEEAAEMIALLLDGAVKVLAEPLSRVVSLIDGAGTDSAGAGAHSAGTRDEILPDAFPSDESVAEIAALVNHSLRQVGRFAFPPAIRVESVDRPGSGGHRSGAEDSRTPPEDSGDEAGLSAFTQAFQYVLPGMATFALFILAAGLMGDLPRERGMGTLGRQLAAPVHARAVIAGKVLATLLTGLLVAAAMSLVGALLLGGHANPVAFALLCLLFLVAVTGLITFLYSFARSQQQGSTVVSIVVMVMALLGGSWIPLQSMPSVFQTLAKGTLNYWAIEGFRDLMFSDAGVPQIVLPLIIFLAVGIISTLLSAFIMQRKFAQGV